MTSMFGLRLRGQLGCLSLSLEIALSSSSWSEVSTILRRAARVWLVTSLRDRGGISSHGIH